MTTNGKYAIAVEDRSQLFLFLDITRTASGNVYVKFNERYLNDNPHSSYHATGQRHHKRNNQMVLPKKILQRPDGSFKNSENVIETAIRRGDGRAWGIICKKEMFDAIMIIKDEIIYPQFGFKLSIDLYESGSLPSGYDSCVLNIIQQQIFNSDVPKIVATLYEVVSPSKS